MKPWPIFLALAACGGEEFSLAPVLAAETRTDASSQDAGAETAPDAEPQADAWGDAQTSLDAGSDHEITMQDAAREADACVVTHSNGLGQTFIDCVALGTHDQTQALKACVAFTGDIAKCKSFNDPGVNACLGTQQGAACATWEYAGPAAGHAANDGGCFCPTVTDPTWN